MRGDGATVLNLSLQATLIVMLGSALGGGARLWMSTLIARGTGSAFPWGTLGVNIAGCLAVGILAALFAPPERVRREVRRVLDAFGNSPGHVFNLGHGIAPKTPVESVAALVDEVRTYSRQMRASVQTNA